MDFDQIYRLYFQDVYRFMLTLCRNESLAEEIVVGEGYDDFNLPSIQKDERDIKIKALYYGSPKNAQLIWKEGMELPKASEELEQQLQIN